MAKNMAFRIKVEGVGRTPPPVPILRRGFTCCRAG